MPQETQFTQLRVQDLPGAGVLVRFLKERIVTDDDVTTASQELGSLVAPERIVLVDLGNIVYLSSAMLCALTQVRRRLVARSGEMMLCGMPPDIAEIFRITRLEELFQIYPNLESALGRDGVRA